HVWARREVGEPTFSGLCDGTSYVYRGDLPVAIANPFPESGLKIIEGIAQSLDRQYDLIIDHGYRRLDFALALASLALRAPFAFAGLPALGSPAKPPSSASSPFEVKYDSSLSS